MSSRSQTRNHPHALADIQQMTHYVGLLQSGRHTSVATCGSTFVGGRGHLCTKLSTVPIVREGASKSVSYREVESRLVEGCARIFAESQRTPR